MKIKQITMREDGEMKIKAVSGKDVTIDQGGTEVKTTTDALVPDAEHPGGFTMKPADPNQLKPGAPVTSSDSGASMEEEIEDDSHGDQVKKVIKRHGESVGEIGIDPQASPGNGKWYVKHYASGHDMVGYDDAEEALAELRHIIKHSMEESHHDLISQGNQDVGGDATDNFIDQVVDKKWEKANRGPTGPGTRSPLSEKDELYKWLTIAGIK
jgi:hypothetical protein